MGLGAVSAPFYDRGLLMVRLVLKPRRGDYASGREFVAASVDDARRVLAALLRLRDMLEAGVRPKGVPESCVEDVMALDFFRSSIRLAFSDDGTVALVVR